jgi:LPS O-antigen subunit length determinant protein (WzzB/FepE family)
MTIDKKTIIIVVLVFMTCIAIVIATAAHKTLTMQETVQHAASTADKAKEEAQNEIENTDPGDLVDVSSRAEKLIGTRNKPIDEFFIESRDLIRQILQRGDSQNAP